MIFQSILPTSPDCGNDPFGSVQVSVNSGIPNYTIRLYSDSGYTILIGTSTSLIDNQVYTFTGLVPNTYYLKTTDSLGNILTDSFTIDSGILISGVITSTDATTFGGSDGTITITSPTGGIPPYKYKLDSGSFGYPNVFTGLSAGDYTITIEDSVSDCTFSQKIPVGQPVSTSISDIQVSIVSNVLCNGQCNGILGALVSGTTVGTVTFSWTKNGVPGYASTQVINNVCSGTYIVTVTDDNGPVLSSPLVFIQPSIIDFTLSSTIATCNGGNNGSITLSSLSGGSGVYTFLYTGPNGFSSSLQNLTNLYSGDYTCVVTDSNGCTRTKTISVATHGAISDGAIINDVSCYGNNTGSIILTPSGGVGPYTYLWNTEATTSTISNLYAGTYSVVITDSLGCTSGITDLLEYTVNTITQVNINSIIVQPSLGNCNGSITVQAYGGDPESLGYYNYHWSTGVNDLAVVSSTIDNLCPGTYTVTIPSDAGDDTSCTRTFTFILVDSCPNFDLTNLKVFLLNTQCCFAKLLKEQNNLILEGRQDLADCLTGKLQLLNMIISRLYCITNIIDSNFTCDKINNLISTAKEICPCDCCDDTNKIQVTWDNINNEFIIN